MRENELLNKTLINLQDIYEDVENPDLSIASDEDEDNPFISYRGGDPVEEIHKKVEFLKATVRGRISELELQLKE